MRAKHGQDGGRCLVLRYYFRVQLDHCISMQYLALKHCFCKPALGRIRPQRIHTQSQHGASLFNGEGLPACCCKSGACHCASVPDNAIQHHQPIKFRGPRVIRSAATEGAGPRRGPSENNCHKRSNSFLLNLRSNLIPFPLPPTQRYSTWSTPGTS